MPSTAGIGYEPCIREQAFYVCTGGGRGQVLIDKVQEDRFELAAARLLLVLPPEPEQLQLQLQLQMPANTKDIISTFPT